MTLSEIEFAFFFPLLFALYWLLPRYAWLQNTALLVGSYLFYATWNLKLLPLFVGSTVLDFAVALYIGKEGAKYKKLAFAISLIANLGTLADFKYAGFFADSLNGLFGAVGIKNALPVLRIALPIGISFYTMQRVGYLIDVYNEKFPPTRSFLAWATYVSFFPQLIAGPIGRAQDMIPQYEAPRRFDPDKVSQGAMAFLLGILLKSYVADRLAEALVNPVFAEPTSYSAPAHWAALIGYGAQVFSDFAGYSLLALGAGRMLGVELPQNFNYPFIATSLPDFWRRWHMSLNNWLFDYIYGPLTMGRGFFRGRLDLGFVVVFLISGLWHGAAWTFVLWGLCHGLGLVVQHRYDEYYKTLCRKDRVWVKRRKSTPYKLVAWAITQVFFFVTLVPFRGPTMGAMATFAKGLVRGGAEKAMERPSVHVVLCFAILVGLHLIDLKGARIKALFFSLPAPLRGLAYGAFVVFLMLVVPVGAGAFIYAQF